jgi:hypothetical protein
MERPWVRTVLVIPSSLEVLTRDMVCDSWIDSVEFLPNSNLWRIGEQALSRCDHLESICIPASVEVLGKGCFPQCLKTVTFEARSRLRIIEEKAFGSCWLHTICLPASVSEIDSTAFAKTKLTAITFESGNRHFRVHNHLVLSFDETSVVLYFGKDSNLQIPASIETISANTFSERPFICSVSFGSSSKLRVIGGGGFASCLSLSGIHLPASLREVEPWAFACCPRLSSVTFDSNSQLTRISGGVFHGCRALMSFAFPSSIEYVGARCFSDCWNLSRLSFEPPSHLRELRSLPPSLPESLDVPDSVEVFSVIWEGEDPRPTFRFGVNSKLSHVSFARLWGGNGWMGAFIRISERGLKDLRSKREFSD